LQLTVNVSLKFDFISSLLFKYGRKYFKQSPNLNCDHTT